MKISPAYKMEIISKLETEIWNRFKSHQKVEQYIRFFQDITSGYGETDFEIAYINGNQDINLMETLGNIAEESESKLIKIAIDLDIETPDFIPTIPTFRNKLKDDYKNAATSFEKAFQNVEYDPSESVSNANSVIESILKEILKDERFSDINASQFTMGKLISIILKKFELNPGTPELPKEMKVIGNSLISISKAIEDLRSRNTLSHGQDSNKYLIDEPLYAYFVINACATVGLFLIDFYENKFPRVDKWEIEDLPF